MARLVSRRAFQDGINRPPGVRHPAFAPVTPTVHQALTRASPGPVLRICGKSCRGGPLQQPESHSDFMKSPYQSIPCVSECLLCGSHAAHSIESRDRRNKPLHVVICDGCGVVHNDPIPSAADLSRFYAGEYRASYKGTREPRLKHAARYFPAVARHIHHHWRHYQPAQRILDIGSGSGEFLYFMRELGKHAAGLEPTQDYARFCRTRLGLNITTGEIDSFTPNETYDHIRLYHVVEHLRDPVANLRRVSQWLADRGTLYVEVPDFERYCRTKTPGMIFHYGHIYNFDRETFEFMIRQAGLEIIDRTGPTSAFLRRAPSRCAMFASPAEKWPVPDKIAFYQQHKDGQLRVTSRIHRSWTKMIKMFNEHMIVVRHPGHVTLANQAARSLQELISR